MEIFFYVLIINYSPRAKSYGFHKMLNASNGLSRPAFHVLCLHLPFTSSALVNSRCFQLKYDLAEYPQAKNSEGEKP